VAAVNKGKVVDKNSTFQSRWIEEYFLFVLKELLFALFVMKLSALKEYDIKRHFKTKHVSQLSGIQDQLRRDKITLLQNHLAQQQILFRSSTLQLDMAVCIVTWFLKF